MKALRFASNNSSLSHKLSTGARASRSRVQGLGDLKLYGRLFGSGDDANSPKKVVCFGNVLLDHLAVLNDTELLDQFELKLETKGELDVEELSKITTAACERVQCVANPGGSALNTTRILRLLGTDALFFGAVGEDKQAEKLKEILKQNNIDARLQSVSDVPTGQCICLAHDGKTALFANIGASSKFTLDFLKKAEYNETQPFLRPIERKQILYVEGFFVPQRAKVAQHIVNTYIRERRRLALNLNATYIVEQNFKEILFLARNAYFIFGNQTEFQALCDQMQCASTEDMARELIKGGAVKIMCITKGADGIQLISNYEDEYSGAGNLTFQCFNAPRVEEVVDTTGAGDAFVAGFLHAFLEKRSLSECVRQASDVAAKVVTQYGCNLPQSSEI